MENPTLPFPKMPTGTDKSIIKPSPAFKKQIYRSAGAIILFVFTYLFLLFGSIAIAIASGLLGYNILTTQVTLITVVIGMGFIISGLMLVFFVIKFLFKRTCKDYSGMAQIDQTGEPGLFEFIRKLTTETGSPMPGKIFITADVNAGVSYNSSFWSMFFPVSKNLQIGLGLVNSVNISEFKAIMAHEFGHFSQRSMKFGSYVYNLNKVIHNMLYDNQGYEKVLGRWARMHYIFRLMAWLNINIIKGMQSILKKIYVIVNKTYMGLSREMEFHADAIAAYASGSNQAISSLKRIEIGQLCYNDLLNYWGVKLDEGKRSDNLYPQHSEVIKFYSNKHGLTLDVSGLPIINDDLQSVSYDSIEVDDPWLSHPLTADRESHLKSLNLDTDTVIGAAWSIFENPKKIQEKLTAMIYAGAQAKDARSVEDIEEFKRDFFADLNHHLYNPLYKNYFDNRDLTQFDVDEAMQLTGELTTDKLFFDENCKLPVTAAKLQQNINSLDQIIEIRKDVKYFYYRSSKLSRGDAVKLKDTLIKELSDARNRIKDLDKSSFVLFYNLAKDDEAKEQLVNKYRLLFKYQNESTKDRDLYNDIFNAMRPVYTKMKPTQINETVNNVYRKEKAVKPRIKEIIADDVLKKHISAGNLKAMETYLKTSWIYYLNPTYDKTALTVFNEGLNAYISTIYNWGFEIKKDLLDFQVDILNK